MMGSGDGWKKLLATPGPDAHIVQLYQDDEFFGEAISHFAAEGLVRGESIILVATLPHWKIISERLLRKGFNLEELQRRDQLTVLDADHSLPKLLDDNMPHAATFKEIAQKTIERARGGGKYPRVRWWGEMVNLLYLHGNRQGSIRMEELVNEVAHEEQVAFFCSFFMDKFDASIYRGPLGDVCRTHTNLIPAENERAHRECIDQAVEEVLGGMDGPLLKSLLSGQRAATVMPASQAVLLRLQENFPNRFEEILSSAQRFEHCERKGAQ